MEHGKPLRIANGAMFFVFVSWAFFQYNDPDFFIWALTYGIAALCCLLFFIDRLSPTFGAAVAIGALLWAAFLGYFVLTEHVSFSMRDPSGEMAREAIGLLVVAGWVGFISRKTTLAKRRSRGS